MLSSNRHVAPVMCQQDVLALIYRPVCVVGNPLSVGPADAPAPIVSRIGLAIDVTEVAKAVIRAIAVDVVNVLRLFTVNKEPRKPMNVVSLAVNADLIVPSLSFGGLATRYFACVGVVLNNIAHRIRNNFRSHAELPLSVVRGLVVRATSTPILPIASNICKEFASSGGNSRGAYGPPPCFNYPTPL